MSSSYQVIARKWRPQSFQELIGQDSVGQSLQNAFVLNRIPQVLLFTGPRGTGKTSTARIVAKTLRCEKRKEKKAPCNVCSECQEILSGHSLQVIEIDGASNNGVDAIRELRDSVNYRPSHGFYKVYIIDEVHMLSASAFNALLKTLEEPPEHVVFILATTEVHKLPETILSRCQKFQFKRVPSNLVVKRLEEICKKEKVEYEKEALWHIAYEGEGSVRDSESLLEQVITFSKSQVKSESIYEILGLSSRKNLLALIESLLKQDKPRVLKIMESLKTSSQEPTRLLKNILQVLRDLLVIKVWGESCDLVEISDAEKSQLQKLAHLVQGSHIHKLFDLFLHLESTLRMTSSPFMALEMSFLKATTLGEPFGLETKKQVSQQSSEETEKKVSQPEKRTSNQAKLKSASVVKKTSSLDVKKTSSSKQDCDLGEWESLVKTFKLTNPMMSSQLKSLVYVKNEDGSVTLKVPLEMSYLYDKFNKELKPKLVDYMNTKWSPGQKLNFELMGKNEEGVSSIKKIEQKREKAHKDKIKKEVESEDMVQMAKKLFQAQVESITSPKEEK